MNLMRQLDILGPHQTVYPITFIGLGGIGSFTVELLRRMGFKEFRLYDMDRVEEHNVASQNYVHNNIGKTKVSMTSNRLKHIFKDDVSVTCFPEAFTGSETLEGIVLSGVDNMLARKNIWEAVKRNKALVPLYVDGRIGVDWDEEENRLAGEWLQTFTVSPASVEDCTLYEASLFSDDEAAPFRCTAQAVAYLGYFIAAFMGSNVKKWICEEQYPRRLVFDALTLDTVSVTMSKDRLAA